MIIQILCYRVAVATFPSSQLLHLYQDIGIEAQYPLLGELGEIILPVYLHVVLSGIVS